MYNKKAISDALAKLNKAKAPKQEPDIIYSPRGQWDHPGEVTRVPSEHITMQGVHTPLLGIVNMGNQQMMYPGAEYTFPGADYVDEYPQMKSGGNKLNHVVVKQSKIPGANKGLFSNQGFKKNQLIGLAHRNGQPVGHIGKMHNHSDEPNMYSIKHGNERYVYAKRDIQPGEELTTNYRLQPELEQPEDFMRKGGSAPKLPKKKNSRAYSRSLEATNKFFAEHAFFAKPKSRKNKIYDPNAKYYQDGGATSPEEWEQQIRSVESQIGNPADWTMDDYYLLQDKLNAYRNWRETTPEGQAVVDYHNEEGEYDVPLPEHLQDYTNGMMKARLAYADMHGNPAAKRMINIPDNPYDFGNGMTGTHYMSSMDNYAVPQIQNVNGQLTLGDFEPSSNEAIKFDNPNDARYFAEHYKEVSPGFIEAELTPEEIEQYRKGGYVVEELPKAQSGIKRPVSRKPIDYYLDGPKAPEASDRAQVSMSAPTEQEIVNTVNYNKAVGEQAKAIKEAKPGISHRQAMNEAEFLIQNSQQPQSEIRQLDVEGVDKDRVFLDKAGDAQSFGDYSTTAWNVITNPIDAATAFMSPGGFGNNFNINQNAVEKLQRQGLLETDTWQNNAMMNTVSMLPYVVPGLGQIAALRDLYQSVEQLAYNPSLENAGWAALDLIGARMGVTPASNRLLRMQTKKALGNVADYATKQTPLRNAYKLNPWAFKPDTEAAYRMLGTEKGFQDAIDSGFLKPGKGSDIGKVHAETHYQLGVPSDKRKYFGRTWDRGYEGPYMAEVPNAITDPRFAAGPAQKEIGTNVWTYPNNYIPSSEVKFYKQDWLRGYKPVKTPTSPFNTRAQNDLLVEQARRSGEAPLPDYMEPFLLPSKVVRERNPEFFDYMQSVEETFRPINKNTKVRRPVQKTKNAENKETLLLEDYDTKFKNAAKAIIKDEESPLLSRYFNTDEFTDNLNLTVGNRSLGNDYIEGRRTKHFGSPTQAGAFMGANDYDMLFVSNLDKIKKASGSHLRDPSPGDTYFYSLTDEFVLPQAGVFFTSNPETYKKLYNQGKMVKLVDDVTLANKELDLNADELLDSWQRIYDRSGQGPSRGSLIPNIKRDYKAEGFNQYGHGTDVLSELESLSKLGNKYYNKPILKNRELHEQFANLPVKVREAELSKLKDFYEKEVLKSKSYDDSFKSNYNDVITILEKIHKNQGLKGAEFKQGGIILELDENQIQKYLDGGYIVEEL